MSQPSCNLIYPDRQWKTKQRQENTPEPAPGCGSAPHTDNYWELKGLCHIPGLEGLPAAPSSPGTFHASPSMTPCGRSGREKRQQREGERTLCLGGRDRGQSTRRQGRAAGWSEAAGALAQPRGPACRGCVWAGMCPHAPRACRAHGARGKGGERVKNKRKKGFR